MKDALPKYVKLANLFNDGLRSLETLTGHGANFIWVYTQEGKKELRVADVGALTKPCPAVIAASQEFVAATMERADKEFYETLDTTQKQIADAMAVDLKDILDEVKNVPKP